MFHVPVQRAASRIAQFSKATRFGFVARNFQRAALNARRGKKHRPSPTVAVRVTLPRKEWLKKALQSRVPQVSARRPLINAVWTRISSVNQIFLLATRLSESQARHS